LAAGDERFVGLHIDHVPGGDSAVGLGDTVGAALVRVGWS
jgi:hypothetical protein